MKVTVTVTRFYEMDEARILAEPAFEPPSPGFSRDEDHIDGGYVWLIDEDDDTDYEWPEALR